MIPSRGPLSQKSRILRFSISTSILLRVVSTLAIVVTLASVAFPLRPNSLRATAPGDDKTRLIENLRRFDKLPLDQQAALRDLDTALAAAPASDRRRLLNLLHRHAAWLSTLPESRQAQLAATTPAERLALIEKWHQDGPHRPRTLPAFENALQVSTLATESIRRTAVELRVWFALDPRRRDSIKAEATDAKQLEAYRSALRADPATARARDQARREFGLDLADLRDRPPEPRRLDRLRPAAFKADQSRRILDLQAIRVLDPDGVPTETLSRFEADLPEWVRRTLDPFAPDAARRRLALLYRLVFPAPGEMS